MLLASIDAYLQATGTSARQFSLMVSKDHKWLSRLRRGQVTLSSIEKAERVLAAANSNCSTDGVAA